MDAVPQQVGKFPRIAQAEIESLSGDRVQRLRGIAEQHTAR